MNEVKKNVLIIDDDRNIFALTATLRAKELECISCIDAFQGQELMEGPSVIDAVLMDMMMPGMDGYETMPKMRNIPFRKDAPVFAVTAQVMSGDREKCLADADDYISKPFDVDKLLHLLFSAIH